MEEDNRRWKDFLYSWVGQINAVKTARLLKANGILKMFPSKFQLHFLQN